MNDRAVLLWVWLAGFAACIGVLLLLFVKHVSIVGNLPTHFSLLSGIYAPYIGTIFAYWFSGRTATTVGHQRSTFRVALAVSVLFQIVVFVILASTFFDDVERGSIENALKVASEVSTGMAVVTAVPIGYFFGKEQA